MSQNCDFMFCCTDNNTQFEKHTNVVYQSNRSVLMHFLAINGRRDDAF